MQSANRLQKALRSSQAPSFGAWQTLPGHSVTRAIARTGFDWICVDTEHGNIDDGAMHEAVATIAGCGVSPVVRIAANEGWMVKRALDSGAHGIIVPLLETPDDAKKLVQSAKFPPMGRRGLGSPFAMERFGHVSLTEYLQQANDALLTIIQIETKEALSHVNAIAQVPGVDCLFVGPFDLGNNIGHPILNGQIRPELVRSIQRVREVAEANGKACGIYATSGEQAKEFAEQGFNMISAVTDMVALPQALQSALQTARGG